MEIFNRKFGTLIFVSTVILSLFQPALAEDKDLEAVAQLHPTARDDIKGVVTFTPQNGKLKVKAQVTGLTPGKHGFHIHEFGDCTAHDAESAGNHFAPENNPHGAPNDEKRHAGDLGNLVANEQGHATLDLVVDEIMLSGERSIVGRAVIVHEKADSFTQPSGDSGGRVACGVIGLKKLG